MIEEGGYVAPNGARVNLSASLARCLEGTRHLDADAVGRIIEAQRDVAGTCATKIEVENETTLAGLAALLVQDDGPVDGLRRQWPPPAVDTHKHYGYAFQWFALCALILILYVWFQLVRPRLRRHP